MKTWHIVLLIVVLLAAFTSAVAAQAPDTSKAVPKYDLATEVTIKGTITEVSERNCPVSGSMGFHLVIKSPDGKTIEAHIATTKFMKAYDMTLIKGDQIELVGSKVTFEGVETIFAREVTRENETFIFRDKTGKPVW